MMVFILYVFIVRRDKQKTKPILLIPRLQPFPDSLSCDRYDSTCVLLSFLSGVLTLPYQFFHPLFVLSDHSTLSTSVHMILMSRYFRKSSYRHNSSFVQIDDSLPDPLKVKLRETDEEE